MKPLESTHILARIVEAKRKRLERTKMRVPEAVVKHFALKAPVPPSLRDALQNSKPVRILAEVKKASPSKGVFSQNFSVSGLVDAYTSAGASAISVVTEEDFFQGDLGWVSELRERSPLPVLRKDFITEPYQVFESRALGADCVLLIAAALARQDMQGLEASARSLGMAVLVEVHDAAELESALSLRTPLIGINNRDLRTFETRLQTTLELRSAIPDGRIVVSESGIAGRDEVALLRNQGVHAFLIGEAFMRSPDPGRALQDLIN